MASGQFHRAPSPAGFERTTHVFVCYTHEDERHARALRTHLAPLWRGLGAHVTLGRVHGAFPWDRETRAELLVADVVLVLVSADLLASNVLEREMIPAFQRHEQRRNRLLAILARDARLEGTPLDGLQVLPRNGRSIAKWKSKDTAWTEISTELAHLLKPVDVLSAEASATQRVFDERLPASSTPVETSRAAELDTRSQVITSNPDDESSTPGPTAAASPVAGPPRASAPRWRRYLYAGLLLAASVAIFLGVYLLRSRSARPFLPAVPVNEIVAQTAITVRGGMFRGRLIRDFSIDVHEVTVGAYLACVNTGACRPHDPTIHWRNQTPEDKVGFDSLCTGRGPEYADYPINCVSVEDASVFCRWQHRRLPSIDEWQYLAHGGTADTRYPWGDEARDEELCWRRLTAPKDRRPNEPFGQGPCPVESFPADSFGVHDIVGNVLEWTTTNRCESTCTLSGDSVPEPGAPPMKDKDGTPCDELRCHGGGSWASSTQTHLAAQSSWFSTRSPKVGFRCAASID